MKPIGEHGDKPITWKNVPGYEGYYEVSDTGLVRNWVTWQILKPRENTHGKHLLVNLSMDSGLKTFYVHKLVAEVFVENPEEFKYVRFRDGDKTNVSADNLYWTNSKKPWKGYVLI